MIIFHCRRRRSGTVSIWVAICLTIILAGIAFSLDGGRLLSERRHAQATADAAALAAANDLLKGWARNSGNDVSNRATNSAFTTAAGNGYTNDGTTNSVTVNVTPALYAGGPNQGQAIPPGYAEVIVQYYETRSFSAIFNSGTITVSARAVAAVLNLSTASSGIVVLNPHAQFSLAVAGRGLVSVKSGNIVVDSDNSIAAILAGNGNVDAPEVDITGFNRGWQSFGGGTFTSNGGTGNIRTNVAATPDPLGNIPPPDTSLLDKQSSNQLNISSDTSLQPGRYKGGIAISGGNVTLAPGIYYMDQGGFSISDGTVTGTGVLIYSNPGNDEDDGGQGIALTGGTWNLSAPSSGPYQGIAIFQSRSNQAPIVLDASSSCQLIGAVYSPAGQIDLAGTGGAIIGSEFISDTLNIFAAGDLNMDWSGHARPVIQAVRLVE